MDNSKIDRLVGGKSTALELDTRDLVAEIRHIGRTDSPENIAARLGFTVEGLSKRLYREGFPELAAPFSAFRDRGARGVVTA